MPYSPHHKRQPKEPKRDWHDNATLWVAILALVVVAVATGISGWTGVLMRDQLTEMKAQRELLSDQNKTILAQQAILESQQRPWISVEILPESAHLLFTDSGLLLLLTAQTKNVGQAAGIGIDADATVFTVPEGANGAEEAQQIKDRQTAVCNEMRRQTFRTPADFGYTLFPNETGRSLIRGNVPADDIARDKFRRQNEKGEFIRLTVAGCVDYQFYVSTARHQTRFAYNIERAAKQGIPPLDSVIRSINSDAIPVGNGLSSEPLRFVKALWGNGEAN